MSDQRDYVELSQEALIRALREPLKRTDGKVLTAVFIGVDGGVVLRFDAPLERSHSELDCTG